MSLAAGTLTVLLALVHGVWSQNYTSSGGGGVDCGDHRCLCRPRPATCDGDTCVCQDPYSQGLGSLFCVRENKDICYLHSDPLVRSFNGDKYHDVNLLLRNTMTITNVSVCTPTGIPHPTLRCQVQVFAWGERVRGKNFAKGVDVFYFLSTGGQVEYQFYGQVEGGSYTFTRYGNITADLAVPGYGQTGFSLDSANNILSISGLCGVKVFLRPVDPDNPNVLPSGVAVAVARTCNPVQIYTNVSLCGSSNANDTDLHDVQQHISEVNMFPVNVSDAALWAVLNFPTGQQLPGSSPVLVDIHNLSLNCSESSKTYAVPQCSFILNNIKFIKCSIRESGLDSNSAAADDLIFQLFYDCLHIFCHTSLSECVQFQAYLAQSACTVHVDLTQNTILNYDCELMSYSNEPETVSETQTPHLGAPCSQSSGSSGP